ncbi:MAG: CDP-glycerol glycerophosphotransferase family protein [Clostridiales bacterium]|nr:CDP-glycerol glycerophosphotransferase family protein [Clostridiales bacterium]
MKAVKISVIIPVYNVEEFLAQCLDSVVKQNAGSVRDGIEVITVNDGSTDGSGEIARAYAEKYDYFKYYEIKNSSVGYARNYAVQLAEGEYIAFVDSDDILADGIYDAMYTLARKNSSDLTICNVLRFNSSRQWKSVLQEKAFKNIDSVTHIKKNTNLIYDTTIWNKLIRRDYYLEHNFKFPEKILYEDIPVAFEMHYFANNVSVVKNYGYLWRVRDEATKSITQNASDFANFSDRLKIMKMFDKFFDENVGEKELHEAKRVKYLNVDLRIFINTCINLESNHQKIVEQTREYIKDFDPELFRKIPVIDQAKYSCVLSGDTDTLKEILSFEKSHYKSLAAYRENGDFKAEFPQKYSHLISSNSLVFETALYEIKRYADKIYAKKRSFEITARLWYDRFSVSQRSEQSVKAYLYNEVSNSRLPLTVEYFENTLFTESKGITADTFNQKEVRYNYDATGFKIIINPLELELSDEFVGRNNILMEYENQIDKGSVFLEGAPSTETKRTDNFGYVLDDKTLIKLEFSYNQSIILNVVRDNIFAENTEIENDEVAVELDREADSLFAKLNDGGRVEFKKNGGKYTAPIGAFDEDTAYSLCALTDCGEKDVLSKKAVAKLLSSGGNTVGVSSNRTHIVRLSLYSAVAKVSEIEPDNNLLKIRCRSVEKIYSQNKPVATRLYVFNELSQKKIVLADGQCSVKNSSVDSEFVIDFGDSSVTKNLSAGIRDIFIEYIGEEATVGESRIFNKKHLIFNFEVSGQENNIYTSPFGIIRLKSQSVRKNRECTDGKINSFAVTEYPKLREKPIEPRKIVFESMWGAKYGGNPRALYEYIDENYPEFECIWFLKDEYTPIKGNAKRVLRGSAEYFDALATAKYFVNDVNFSSHYVKRDGQIEIQTMHGTPLKTLGLDVAADFKTEEQKKEYISRCGRWDYLITQGKFVDEKASEIFNFHNTLLKTGYPRTDELFNRSKKTVSQIKEKLNIADDKKIILYTPTWRTKKIFDMRLDIDKMREKLGGEYILLVRIHHLCTGGYSKFADNSFVFDMSKYQNAEELYLISDILITDYSSVMFDYSLLKRPMIFYTYDLKDYTAKRGFYADYEAEMPGTVVNDTESLIEAVLDSSSQSSKYRDKIKAFNKKYLGYENPDSCKAVVKTVFDEEIKKIRKERFLNIFKGNK